MTAGADDTRPVECDPVTVLGRLIDRYTGAPWQKRYFESGQEAREALAALAARVEELEAFVAAIDAAHDRHLRTGDYLSLGIAAQDALLALRAAGKVE